MHHCPIQKNTILGNWVMRCLEIWERLASPLRPRSSSSAATGALHVEIRRPVFRRPFGGERKGRGRTKNPASELINWARLLLCGKRLGVAAPWAFICEVQCMVQGCLHMQPATLELSSSFRFQCHQPACPKVAPRNRHALKHETMEARHWLRCPIMGGGGEVGNHGPVVRESLPFRPRVSNSFESRMPGEFAHASCARRTTRIHARYHVDIRQKKSNRSSHQAYTEGGGRRGINDQHLGCYSP